MGGKARPDHSLEALPLQALHFMTAKSCPTASCAACRHGARCVSLGVDALDDFLRQMSEK
ncbi:MAG TPA: hypothetical protein VF509_16955 [Sphingobium sp.]